MLHYRSLLKGKIFKNKRIKSSFLIEDTKKPYQLYNKKSSNKLNIEENSKLKKLSSSIRYKTKKTGDINKDNNSIYIDDDEYISEDYEDLFYFFLFETEKIEYFEKQIEIRKEKKVNNNYLFNYIYHTLTDEKIRWNNFLFSEAVYRILYIKSRKLQKEIIQYSIYSGKTINDIIVSYDKKYTSKKKVKNWHLKPQEAYKNYEKIILKEKTENDNINNTLNPIFKNINYTDFVVKTDNNGKGKTLIFLGKAINIYIDDLDKYHNQDNTISMAIEESEYNKKTKNEIVYTFDDIILKAKKRNMTINNKYELKKINKNKKIDKNQIFKSNLKPIRYSSYDKNEKNKTLIFNHNQKWDIGSTFNNFNNKFKDKLPSIIKLAKPNNCTDRKVLKEIKFDNNDFTNLNINKIDILKYEKEFPKNKRIEKHKKSINSFSIFEKDIIPKNHKKVINFFTKGNSDFYY